MSKRQQVKILWFLVFLMIVNIIFSSYLQMQKNAMLKGSDFVDDSCFVNTIGPGNCADVQFSVYGKFLGVSVPIWGVLAFSFLGLVIAFFAYSLTHNSPINGDDDLNTTRKFISLCLIVGSIVAIFFIYLQFFVLNSICKYCMVVDSITIISLIIYTIKFKKSVSFHMI